MLSATRLRVVASAGAAVLTVAVIAATKGLGAPDHSAGLDQTHGITAGDRMPTPHRIPS